MSPLEPREVEPSAGSIGSERIAGTPTFVHRCALEQEKDYNVIVIASSSLIPTLLAERPLPSESEDRLPSWESSRTDPHHCWVQGNHLRSSTSARAAPKHRRYLPGIEALDDVHNITAEATGTSVFGGRLYMPSSDAGGRLVPSEIQVIARSIVISSRCLLLIVRRPERVILMKRMFWGGVSLHAGRLQSRSVEASFL